MTRRWLAGAILLGAAGAGLAAWSHAAGARGPVHIRVDAAADRHPISPLIYGASFASPAVVRDLGLALDRAGGNSASAYDPAIEARSAGRDWFFESLPIAPDEPAQYGARFATATLAAGAAPMVSVPMLGWAATLAPDGGKRAAFSIARYGAQAANDVDGLPDAGNGVDAAGVPITRNDPRDAARPIALAERAAWVRGLVARFGPAARGGIPFYLMDNEPTRWHDIHRDVHPAGLHADEQAALTIRYARMVKAIDPGAQVVAPEEWGWGGYRYSGFDQQVGEAHGYATLPDRTRQTGGMDLLPWLLTQWKRAGHPVDVVSVHYYPQGGEFRGDGRDDVSPAMQALRNRSTRSLWDRTYVDTSWIADTVALIPRLRDWVARYYDAGTPIAITEYNWGADGHMNGATAQADVYGIFAREGLAMAARWMAPAPGTPVYLAMKLWRNYDGRGTGFGETSVAAAAPDPDRIAAFAALRARDGVLTVAAINKTIADDTPVTIDLAHVAPHGIVGGMRLVDGHLASLRESRYGAGTVTLTLPAQSITLIEIKPDAS